MHVSELSKAKHCLHLFAPVGRSDACAYYSGGEIFDRAAIGQIIDNINRRVRSDSNVY